MTPALVQIDGLWWPADDFDARGVITRDCQPAIAALLKHVEGRDCIVQAGANVGTYPLALADLFQAVHTCEPDPTNWACLQKNLAARDSLSRVKALHAAYGEAEGFCIPLEVQPHNCGAHRVSFTRGNVPVWPIDSLGLDACDVIWLDVEGSELPALKGAAQTIDRFNPVIAVEDKGLHRAFDIADGALQKWLANRGYEYVDKIGQDKIFARTP